MNKTLLESLQNLRFTNPFANLEEPFMLIAFLLCVVGFVLNVLREHEDPLRAFLRVATAVMFIAAQPLWTGIVRDVVYFLPYHLLDFDGALTQIYTRVSDAVDTALKHPGLDFSLWDALGAAVMDFIVAILMRLVAGIGTIIAIPILFLQIGAERFVSTAMPVAVAALTIPAARNQAQGFIAFWVSLLTWPLFFAVVVVIANTVFTAAGQMGTTWYETHVSGGILASFVAPFTAGVILIAGILATPPLAYSLCTHGGAALTAPTPFSFITRRL